MEGYRAPPRFSPRVIRYRIASRAAAFAWTLFSGVFGVVFVVVGLRPDAPSPRILWAVVWIAASLLWFIPVTLFRMGADITIDHANATVSIVVRGLSWRPQRKQFALTRVKGAIVEPDDDGEHCQLVLVIEGEAPFALSMEKPPNGAAHEAAAEEIRRALERPAEARA